jgi:hypothetical protein
VRQHAGLHLPHGIEAGYGSGLSAWPTRIAWSLGNGARALMSLPATGAPHADVWLGLAMALLVIAVIAVGVTPGARARLAACRGILVWGALWFTASGVAVATIHPFWAPNRTQYGAFGAGLAAAAILGGAHPGLLAGAVVLRVATLCASPGPPRVITTRPPATGAFMDFEHLVRLQRTMREARALLTKAHPTLPANAVVAYFYLPKNTEYAFGDGGRALQAWYRDSTLRFVPVEQVGRLAGRPVAACLGFEPDDSTAGGGPPPHLLLVNVEAMRAYFEAGALGGASEWAGAIAQLDRADSLGGADSRLFRASITGGRALCLHALGRPDDGWREAERSVGAWSACPDGLVAVALLATDAGRWSQAQAAIDSLAGQQDPRAAPLDRRLEAARARPLR